MSIPSHVASKFNFDLGKLEYEDLKIHKRDDSDDDSGVDSGDVELLFPEDQAFEPQDSENKDKNDNIL